MENPAMEMLESRGVRLLEMARLVWELQQPYNPALSLEDCLASVKSVIAKNEVKHAVITGLTLDEMAEEGTLKEPLGSAVRRNDRLFGTDAMLGLAIVNMYGSIGLSNYGYLSLDRKRLFRCLPARNNSVVTFTDDLVAAIVAAACARIAHGRASGAGVNTGNGTEAGPPQASGLASTA